MQMLHKYKKLPPLIPLIMRHGSYLIVVISIIIPALPWNGNSRSYYKIFSSSKEEHGLFSNSFDGDGDSKAYSAVKDTYGPIKPIKKFECVGYYHKRFGWRLPNFTKNTKGLGGKGKLTNTKTDTMQIILVLLYDLMWVILQL